MMYISVLQSLNEYMVMIIGIIVGLVIKVLVNYIFVVYYGINGVSVVIVLSLVVMFVVMWLGLLEDLQQVLLESGYLIKLFVLSVVMGIVVIFSCY